MRVLITGITGFVGGHLAELLAQSGDEVAGCSPNGKWLDAELNDRAGQYGIAVAACDLREPESVARLVKATRPEQVYHLAAMANPAECLRWPDEAFRVNVEGTRNLYNAIVQCDAAARVLLVSSSYVYGKARPEDLPLAESAPLHGRGHPYADSKLEAERLADEFGPRGLEVVCVRPFNHAGPRQRVHMIAEWARQIAAIEAGQREPRLRHGNLATRRDWTDVRDVVRAYQLLIAGGAPGAVYNLGSGVSRSGREILDRLQNLASVPIEAVSDERLMRRDDAPDMIADASRLRAATGWKPECAIETTLLDALSYWRRHGGDGT